jgi:beta-glucanase (GH16 family)
VTDATSGIVVGAAVADSSGRFMVNGIPNGTYMVTPSSTAAAFTPASANVTINNANYTGASFTAATLVFYDDFTGPSLSSAWTVISRHGEYAQGETECNVPAMVSVANSMLTIQTIARAATCGDFNVDGTVRHAAASWPYETGAIQWTNLNFTYGTVEIRAQFPAETTQVWPATWLLGSNCQITNIYTADTGYSSCPNFGSSGYRELDLTECFGSTWCQTNAYNPGGTCQAPYSVDNNFHIFTTVWTATKVTQAVDGVTVSSCNLNINQPLFLIIQTQTGGVGGTPANLPAALNVDYVKVTQP